MKRILIIEDEQKHVLEIFTKLGVETRTAAGLRALEVLSSPAAK